MDIVLSLNQEMLMGKEDENPKLIFLTACGGKIRNETKYPSAVYQGKRIFFCTIACLKAFEAAPDAFMAGEIEHPVD